MSYQGQGGFVSNNCDDTSSLAKNKYTYVRERRTEGAKATPDADEATLRAFWNEVVEKAEAVARRRAATANFILAASFLENEQ
jgi:hypothetical protein